MALLGRNQKDTHLHPFRRQTALRLGSRAEQRLHGLLPAHSKETKMEVTHLNQKLISGWFSNSISL